MSISQAELCENCGRQMGRLETNYIFKSHIVCEGCNQALSRGVVPRWAPRGISCAQPIAAPVVIERTAKRWKAHMLTAAVMACVGTAVMAGSGAGTNAGQIGIWMMIFGVGWFIAAQVLAWWHHG